MLAVDHFYKRWFLSTYFFANTYFSRLIVTFINQKIEQTQVGYTKNLQWWLTKSARFWSEIQHQQKLTLPAEINLEDYFIGVNKGFHVGCRVSEGDVLTTERRQWVIVIHDWDQNQFILTPYFYLYRQLGMRVLIYDQRGHGVSYFEDGYYTFGIEDCYDLNYILRWLIRKKQAEKFILHGLGAGSILIFEAYLMMDEFLKKNITHFVLENPWIIFRKMLPRITGQHLQIKPLFFARGINRRIKKSINFKTKKLNPHRWCQQLDVPILILSDLHAPEYQQEINNFVALMNSNHQKVTTTYLAKTTSPIKIINNFNWLSTQIQQFFKK